MLQIAIDYNLKIKTFLSKFCEYKLYLMLVVLIGCKTKSFVLLLQKCNRLYLR